MEKAAELRSVEKQPSVVVENKQEQSADAWDFNDINPRNYDEALTARFYNALMLQNFPIDDEREPLEAWVDRLEPKRAEKYDKYHTQHVLVAFAKGQKDKDGLPVIAGGLIYQYFKVGNVALFAYMVIDQNFRRRGLINILIHRAIEILHREAKELGYPHCDLFLAETNGLGVEDGVMKSADRHRVMYGLGMGHLDCAYIQPPLAEGKEPCYDLILIAHKLSPVISGSEGKKSIPVEPVKHHIREYSRVAMWNPDRPEKHLDAPFLKHFMKQFEGVEKMAWNPNLPWPAAAPVPLSLRKNAINHQNQPVAEESKNNPSGESSPSPSPPPSPTSPDSAASSRSSSPVLEPIRLPSSQSDAPQQSSNVSDSPIISPSLASASIQAPPLSLPVSEFGSPLASRVPQHAPPGVSLIPVSPV